MSLPDNYVRPTLADMIRADGPIPKAPPIDHEAVRLEAEKLIEGGLLRGVRPDFRNSVAEANRYRLRAEDLTPQHSGASRDGASQEDCRSRRDHPRDQGL